LAGGGDDGQGHGVAEVQRLDRPGDVRQAVQDQGLAGHGFLRLALHGGGIERPEMKDGRGRFALLRQRAEKLLVVVCLGRHQREAAIVSFGKFYAG
jgi:hypothetical protein